MEIDGLVRRCWDSCLGVVLFSVFGEFGFVELLTIGLREMGKSKIVSD